MFVTDSVNCRILWDLFAKYANILKSSLYLYFSQYIGMSSMTNIMV